MNNNKRKVCRPHRKEARDPYDGIRFWSAATHGFGALLAVLGSVVLLRRAYLLGASAKDFFAFAVYALSMTCLYTASTLYHCLRTAPENRIRLRKYDHISIFLLIAGTYTPMTLIALRGTLGYALFGIVWFLAVCGLIFTVKYIHAPRWVCALIYIAMGWIALAVVVPLSGVLSRMGMFWLFGGGFFYTLGGALYAVKWPLRNNKRFGCHEIFHVFILVGSLFHFLLMYREIVRL